MRLIAIGQSSLLEGFELLGFEIYPDITADKVESLLCGLLHRKEKALIFLEQSIVEHGPCYQHIRRESGDVVIVEVPPLYAPEDYQPAVEEIVRRVLGPGVLEEVYPS